MYLRSCVITHTQLLWDANDYFSYHLARNLNDSRDPKCLKLRKKRANYGFILPQLPTTKRSATYANLCTPTKEVPFPI